MDGQEAPHFMWAPIHSRWWTLGLVAIMKRKLFASNLEHAGPTPVEAITNPRFHGVWAELLVIITTIFVLARKALL
jgi:hypothetical protein